LVLQGGGALGAYQAGVYEALSEAGIHPNWIAGMPIGAIICGDCCRQSARFSAPAMGRGRQATSDTLAFQVDLGSARGEFPRDMFEAMTPEKEIRYSSRTRAATDQLKYAQKLRHTLAGLIRLNAGEVRFSVGAVNVRTGNFVYFDTRSHAISPEDVMASGALPTGFPAIEIEGEHYWDGGLVSNTQSCQTI
jgi:NTE family protein